MSRLDSMALSDGGGIVPGDDPAAIPRRHGGLAVTPGADRIASPRRAWAYADIPTSAEGRMRVARVVRYHAAQGRR